MHTSVHNFRVQTAILIDNGTGTTHYGVYDEKQ